MRFEPQTYFPDLAAQQYVLPHQYAAAPSLGHYTPQQHATYSIPQQQPQPGPSYDPVQYQTHGQYSNQHYYVRTVPYILTQSSFLKIPC